jgi:hypothetical protein
MTILRPAIFGLLLSLASLPAAAQDTLAPGGAEGGADLIERGVRSILEGLFTEMQPALEDMGRALNEMRPMAEQLLKLIDDIGNYEAPVVLENGDILIRRKPTPPEPPRPLQDGEIEL